MKCSIVGKLSAYAYCSVHKVSIYSQEWFAADELTWIDSGVGKENWQVT
jgi:hypothetical protein